MLHKNNIPKEIITVFVANDDEFTDYSILLNPDYYGKIVIGKRGLVNQREFINGYYDDKQKIVSIDDDVRAVDLSMTEYASLDDFLCEAFADCEFKGSYIFGVYPCFNPYFRKNRIACLTCLSYIVGAFYGYINRKNVTELIQIIGDSKEDVERSILYYKHDGIVLRYNRIGIKTKYFGTDGGGLGKIGDRIYDMKINSEILESLYPDFCSIKIRKNGLYEIVLKRLASKVL